MKRVEQTEITYTDANYISWSSIFAGILIVIVGSTLFNLLGMSIGLTLFHPSSVGLSSLTWGTIIWLIVSAFVSMYIGGWVAGYCGIGRTFGSGVLSGVLTSSISLLIFFIVTFSVSGSIISSTFSALNTAVTTTASGVARGASAVDNTAKGINKIAPEIGENVMKALPDLDPMIAKINRKADELLTQNGEVPEEKAKKIKSKLENFMNRYLDSLGKENSDTEDIKKDFNKFLVETSGKTPEEINQILDEWKKTYLEAKEKAHDAMVKASDTIAKTLSRLAMINFVIILLSVIAAAFGGINGSKRRIETV